jgi:Predicted exonuclease of the beta-lactamase fold involved in RNA processing
MRLGQEPLEPIYTAKDAEDCIAIFRGYDYDEEIVLFEGFKLVFKDSGHILGSAIVEMFIKEYGKEEIKLVYSGDLGNVNIPIINNPTRIDYADYVIMETTYGDRLHKDARNELEQLVRIIKETFKRGGNVIIPSFAVGRTQEVIYALNKYVESNILENVRVYIDSPLAQESTRIFQKHCEIFDDEAKELLEKGDDPLDFDGLIFTRSAEESAKLNNVKSGAIIIASSGMCEAGRIKHHLKHNLWRKECSIVFVGYQAEGTLGRAILEGAKRVRLFGEEVAVNAKIYNLHGLSGHADKDGLLGWIKAFKKKPKEVMLVHGDKNVLKSFQRELESNGFKSTIVRVGDKRYLSAAERRIQFDLNKVKNDLLIYINSIVDENITKDDIINHLTNIVNRH